MKRQLNIFSSFASVAPAPAIMSAIAIPAKQWMDASKGNSIIGNPFSGHSPIKYQGSYVHGMTSYVAVAEPSRRPRV